MRKKKMCMLILAWLRTKRSILEMITKVIILKVGAETKLTIDTLCACARHLIQLVIITNIQLKYYI